MLVVIVLWELPGQSQVSPGFDCATASRPIERDICANRGLVALDREMSGLYLARRRQLSGSTANEFISDQRRWLRDRANECSSGRTSDIVACIRDKTAARIAEFRGDAGNSAPSSESSAVTESEDQEIRNWQICHGGRAAAEASPTEKVDACSDIIQRRGDLTMPSLRRRLRDVSRTDFNQQQYLMAYRGRGVLWLRMGRNEEARDDFMRLLLLISSSSTDVQGSARTLGWAADGFKGAALANYHLGRLDEALRVLESIKSYSVGFGLFQSPYERSLELKGDIHMLQRDYGAAVVSYRMYAETIVDPIIKRQDHPEHRTWEAIRAALERKIELASGLVGSSNGERANPSPERSAPPSISRTGPESTGCRLFPNLC